MDALTGIAWDHRRCWGPLDASIAPYEASSGQPVRWDRRSLYSFGEGDLGTWCDRYDLVIYDHPFVGDASRKGWLLDLSQFLTDDDRARFERDAVGASWRSYAYAGGVWGLPIDTAAQTAAWRTDLLQRLDATPPTTISGTLELAALARRHGLEVGWAAKPTDLMCTLVSLAASRGLDPGHDDGDFLAGAEAGAIIEELRALAAAVHPGSRGWNPILCLDHMTSADDVVYAPFLFNYVNYATARPERPIRFGASPSPVAGRPSRTLLGGAGIGISARAKDPEAAFAYAMHLCSEAFQSGEYVANGGQPGSRSAWVSSRCNALTANFLADTLPAMDRAYLRPTHPGFIQLFHDATLKLSEVVFEAAPARPFIDWLNAGYDRLRPKARAA
jgi:multiple sugar transport system substrate-binding protein